MNRKIVVLSAIRLKYLLISCGLVVYFLGLFLIGTSLLLTNTFANKVKLINLASGSKSSSFVNNSFITGSTGLNNIDSFAFYINYSSPNASSNNEVCGIASGISNDGVNTIIKNWSSGYKIPWEIPCTSRIF